MVPTCSNSREHESSRARLMAHRVGDLVDRECPRMRDGGDSSGIPLVPVGAPLGLRRIQTYGCCRGCAPASGSAASGGHGGAGTVIVVSRKANDERVPQEEPSANVMPLRAQDWGGVRKGGPTKRPGDGGLCGAALSRAAIQRSVVLRSPTGPALSVRFKSRTVGGPSFLWGH